MRFALGLLVGALAAAGMACRGPTITEYNLAISLPDSVVAKRSTNEVNLTIGIKLTNHDTEIVFHDDCGHALQKREGDVWRAIWSPPCRSSGFSYALNPGESHLFTFTRRVAATATEWPAVNAAGEYRVVLWLTATPLNSHGFRPEILGPASRTSPVFGVREVVVVFQKLIWQKRRAPAEDGLASSAGAFPLAVIDDSVRCPAPECSHVKHLALVERVRLRCLAARETSVVSSDLTTRTTIRTFGVPRYDDVSPERIRFRKPVTEAEAEYIATDVLVKRNFSTTFS